MNNLFEAMAEAELREMLRNYLERLPESVPGNKAERDRIGKWLAALAMRATPGIYCETQARQLPPGMNFR
jgi:hypothetical protein